MNKEPRFPYILDQKPGLFLNWFMYMLFKRVRFDTGMTERLRQMHRDGTVVYAIKYKSHLDYLLMHYCFLRHRLPFPTISFGINMFMFLPLKKLYGVVRYYIKYFFSHMEFPSPFKTGFYRKAVERGATFILPVVNPKGFYEHFIHAEHDQIQFLVETQQEIDRPIYIVPALILYKKAQEKENPGIMDILFGYKDNPGFIRKVALFFRYHRRAFIDFGTPLNLKEYLDNQEFQRPVQEISEEVNHRLIDSIDAQKRVLIGPVKKSRHQLKEIVLKDEDVVRVIREMSGGDPVRLQQTKKKASGYFDEIAADFSMTCSHFSHMILSWLWKKIFQGIDVDEANLGELREYARKAPLVYVPSHKSHVDYLVLNDILFIHHLPLPLVAAGKNLSFWPIGKIFRKNGAFFIRRSFKGARLYAAVLTRYIKAIIQDGYAVEFFIEGGRSRSGKLILPQKGFLSILVDAYMEGYCEDLMFVPASITYDSIPEQKSYIKEIKGHSKDKENFKQVLKARRILKRKHGRIYIRFAKAISLSEYVSESTAARNTAIDNLAMRIVRSINRVTMVTPLALVSTAIVSRHRRVFHSKELLNTACILLDSMRQYDAPVAENTEKLQQNLLEVLSLLAEKKIIKQPDELNDEGDFYIVEKDKILELEYYKNSIIHFLLPFAFVATSLLYREEDITSIVSVEEDYQFLRHLFKYEFVYNSEGRDRDDIDKVLNFFEQSSFVTLQDDHGVQITRLGFGTLPIWAALTKTFLESYWITANSLLHPMEKGEKVKNSDLLKEMTRQGRKYLELGLIDHGESVSYISFKNAMRFIHKDLMRVRTGNEEESDPFDRLRNFIQKLYDLSHFTR